VLVEADKIESLKEAYPNYFGDVQVFKHNLSRIVRGEDAIEFTLSPAASSSATAQGIARYILV
jgi:hypothetical protein